jgi:hypothetical protein
LPITRLSNSAVDIATWTEAYSQKARHRNIAVLILDHVPKEGGSARGSGRKLDYVDVMWELRNPQPFDRETVGHIELRLRKDREGWLPRVLAYSVGGAEEGFVFKRSLGIAESADEATGLLPSDQTALEALQSLGNMGVLDKEWREEAIARGLGKATYYRSHGTLLNLGHAEKVMGKFFCKLPANQMSQEVPRESRETDGTRANGTNPAGTAGTATADHGNEDRDDWGEV